MENAVTWHYRWLVYPKIQISLNGLKPVVHLWTFLATALNNVKTLSCTMQKLNTLSSLHIGWHIGLISLNWQLEFNIAAMAILRNMTFQIVNKIGKLVYLEVYSYFLTNRHLTTWYTHGVMK